MELPVERAEETLARFFRRCEAIRLAGGIALRDVVDGTQVIPDGWLLDYATDYYIPPTFQFYETTQ